MVNLTVRVEDLNGNGIVGIPVNGKATKNVVWGTNYQLPLSYTNSNGNVVYDNVEANESFTCYANQSSMPNYSTLWTSGQGSTSSGLLGSPEITIVLKKVQSPVGNHCLTGYTMVNGQCVQNSGVTTSSIVNNVMSIFMKYWWIILIFAIVLALLYYLLKKKKGNKPLFVVSNPNVNASVV